MESGDNLTLKEKFRNLPEGGCRVSEVPAALSSAVFSLIARSKEYVADPVDERERLVLNLAEELDYRMHNVAPVATASVTSSVYSSRSSPAPYLGGAPLFRGPFIAILLGELVHAVRMNVEVTYAINNIQAPMWPSKAQEDRLERSSPLSSAASKFNSIVLRKLQRELENNPETDLLSKFPNEYSTRLNDLKKDAVLNTKRTSLSLPKVISNPPSSVENNISSLRATSSAAIIEYPLADNVISLLASQKEDSYRSTCLDKDIPRFIAAIIQAGDVLWQSETCHGTSVVKCDANVVVKIVPLLEDFTEFTTMQYLENVIPEIPAPRPLGLVKIDRTSYIFMTFIPGRTLDKVWPQLVEEQKIAISHQLNDLLLKLRKIPWPDGIPLGGVGGEGCKDTRRGIRTSNQPIQNGIDFDNFIFSNPHFGGSVYITLLRCLSETRLSSIVFSHGDLRLENIMVGFREDGSCFPTGLLDWEKSGFYPEYFECIKATSAMSTMESNDWFLHLPTCIAPPMYPSEWLLDRLWDKHVA
ncbi:MAG: hypothetical protein M1834_003853 [Cirrosporium novae-zelandiae]|nr:MAG: hypothetical protein M1834_003853 [Cirrosporium novae-zelandiae]